jgi:hypothetical protein
MTFELPEPAFPDCCIGTDSTMRDVRIDCYTADQIQAAHAAGRKEALEDAAKCAKAFHEHGYDLTGNLELHEFIEKELK